MSCILETATRGVNDWFKNKTESGSTKSDRRREMVNDFFSPPPVGERRDEGLRDAILSRFIIQAFEIGTSPHPALSQWERERVLLAKNNGRHNRRPLGLVLWVNRLICLG